jgi:hypothetical protein
MGTRADAEPTRSKYGFGKRRLSEKLSADLKNLRESVGEPMPFKCGESHLFAQTTPVMFQRFRGAETAMQHHTQ